jgi:predicted nucleic acid-binding protein
MSPLFADAFFFVAILNRNDQAHARAVVYLNPRPKRRLVTTSWVVTEVGDAMASGPSSRRAFLSLLAALRGDPMVELLPPDPDLFERGLDLYARRPDKEWSLTDCISFVVMADRGLTDALTGDRHFEQAGFRALLRPGA